MYAHIYLCVAIQKDDETNSLHVRCCKELTHYYSPWAEHLEVVIPHLIVRDHLALHRHGSIQPEPVIVAARRTLVQDPLFVPCGDDRFEVLERKKGRNEIIIIRLIAK